MLEKNKKIIWKKSSTSDFLKLSGLHDHTYLLVESFHRMVGEKKKVEESRGVFSPGFWKLCSLVCLEFFGLLESGNFIVLNDWIIFGQLFFTFGRVIVGAAVLIRVSVNRAKHYAAVTRKTS